MAPLTFEEAESMSLDAFLRLEGDEERCAPSSLPGCAFFVFRCVRRSLVDGALGILRAGGVQTVKRFAKLLPSDLSTMLGSQSVPGRCAIIREALDNLHQLAANRGGSGVLGVAGPSAGEGSGAFRCFFPCLGVVHLC